MTKKSKHVRVYLPMHILRAILEKIFWKRRCELKLVCKNWKKVVDEIQSDERLPWLMYFDYSKPIDTCKLFDPSTPTTYSLKKDPEKSKLLLDACTLDIKHGWILLKKCKFTATQFFIYSPFTGETIDFPDLQILGDSWGKIAMSSISPYCIVAQLMFGSHYFKTCYIGSRDWSETFEVIVDEPANLLVDMACGEETVYCLFSTGFSTGKVGEFNIKHQTWRWIQHEMVEGLVVGDRNTHACSRVSICYIDGDIVMLQYLDCYCCPCKAWRLDLKSKKWEAANGDHHFGSKAVFLSKSHSPLFVPASGNAGGYGGNAYDCFYGVAKEVNDFGKNYAFLKNRKPNESESRYWIQPPLMNNLSLR